MVLKLYGAPLSPSVIRVGIVLHEKNIPFELVTVDLFKGEHKTPDFKAKSPFGQIPYIVRTYS
jgi:glutathione S-transferase